MAVVKRTRKTRKVEEGALPDTPLLSDAARQEVPPQPADEPPGGQVDDKVPEETGARFPEKVLSPAAMAIVEELGLVKLPGPGGLYGGVALITVDFARRVMTPEVNRNNRKIKDYAVAEISRDIQAKSFKLNGQSIGFRDDGTLNDGQHRLAGVIETDTAIYSVVIVGVADDVFDTTDVGVKRDIATILNLKGEKSANDLRAALTLLWRMTTGNLQRHKAKPTSLEVIETLGQYPEIRDSLSFCRGLGKLQKIALSSAVPIVLHYIGSMKHGREFTDNFFNALNSGAGLDDNDPIYALRERLSSERQKTTGRYQLRQQDVLGMYLAGWNAHVEGRRLQRLVPIDLSKLETITIL